MSVDEHVTACDKAASQAPALLSAKLAVPGLNDHHVARPRLNEALDRLLRRPFVVIAAPAGYGKTALLSEWAGASLDPVAWVSLDERDNDPTRFWSYFIAALQKSGSDSGAHSLSLLQAFGAEDYERFLTSLLNDLCEQHDGLTVVLDDYEVITSDSIHKGLAFLLEHLPGNCHVLVAGRTLPPFPLSRLAARDPHCVLGTAELGFRPEEIVELLARVGVCDISQRDISLLHKKTEGWIAGLQMVALSLVGRSDRSVFVANFTGSNRLVTDYMTEEVLRHQPQDVRDFLLGTSILERINASLCAAVLEEDEAGARAMLEHLERVNMFIVPLDETRQWYRYHHLFAAALRLELSSCRLGKRQPETITELYERASLWYEREGLVTEAVHMAIAGQSYELAARLLETSFEGMLGRGETITFLRWMETLPSELVRKYPQLWIAKAWALDTTGQFDRAESCLAIAEEAIRGSELFDSSDTRARNLLGALAVVRCARGVLDDEPEQILKFAGEALALLAPDQYFLRCIATVNSVWAHTVLGDFRKARRLSEAALETAPKTGDTFLPLLVRHALSRIEILEGKLHSAAHSMRQIGALAMARDMEHPPIAGFSHIELGSLSYEWNDLPAAEHHANLGIELSMGWWRRADLIEALVTFARVKYVRGDFLGAEMAVRNADALATGKHWSQPVVHVAVAQLRSWMKKGWTPVISARSAASLRHSRDTAHPEIVSCDDALAVVRLLAAEDKFAQAAELLDVLALRVREAGHERRIIEVLVLQALVSSSRGNADQALFALVEALSLAERERYVRMFVDEGAPMFALLQQAQSQCVASLYTAHLISAFGNVGQVEFSPLETPPKSLTRREFEVLALLAEGISPAEIAERFVVSVGTVCNCVNSIHHKLGVHSQLQLVHRARQLGLLDRN